MTYPFGIDVSKWQASADGTKRMDWNKAKSAGIEFAVCRATLGSNYIDPQFVYNWSEMRRLGLRRGAYHYFTPLHPLSQIDKFIDTVKPQAGERLVLDLEYAGLLPKEVLTPIVVKALELTKQLTGAYPIGYSRALWMNACLDMNQLPKIDWWLAQYRNKLLWPLFTPEFDTAKIDIPRGVTKSQIKFHQTGEKGNGKLYGAQSHYIDTDRFIGTQAKLSAYFGQTPLPPPPPDVTTSYKARVTTQSGYNLLVRDAPGGEKTGEVRESGAIVDVYEVVDTWARIDIGKWCSNLFLERIGVPVEGTLNVTPYSQNDVRWKNVRLGTSSTTIGWNGCLISCIAMTLKYYGFDYTPATLNTYLTEHNGYDQGNLLWWGRVPHLIIATWIDCMDIPAPLDKIDAELALGRPCIVHVDFIPSTNIINDHYVTIDGKLGADDYHMIDPFDGFVGSFKSRYVDAKRFIYRIVSYKRGA